jgi:hypothetical protein
VNYGRTVDILLENTQDLRVYIESEIPKISAIANQVSQTENVTSQTAHILEDFRDYIASEIPKFTAISLANLTSQTVKHFEDLRVYIASKITAIANQTSQTEILTSQTAHRVENLRVYIESEIPKITAITLANLTSQSDNHIEDIRVYITSLTDDIISQNTQNINQIEDKIQDLRDHTDETFEHHAKYTNVTIEVLRLYIDEILSQNVNHIEYHVNNTAKHVEDHINSRIQDLQSHIDKILSQAEHLVSPADVRVVPTYDNMILVVVTVALVLGISNTYTISRISRTTAGVSDEDPVSSPANTSPEKDIPPPTASPPIPSPKPNTPTPPSPTPSPKPNTHTPDVQVDIASVQANISNTDPSPNPPPKAFTSTSRICLVLAWLVLYSVYCNFDYIELIERDLFPSLRGCELLLILDLRLKARYLRFLRRLSLVVWFVLLLVCLGNTTPAGWAVYAITTYVTGTVHDARMWIIVIVLSLLHPYIPVVFYALWFLRHVNTDTGGDDEPNAEEGENQTQPVGYGGDVQPSASSGGGDDEPNASEKGEGDYDSSNNTDEMENQTQPVGYERDVQPSASSGGVIELEVSRFLDGITINILPSRKILITELTWQKIFMYVNPLS